MQADVSDSDDFLADDGSAPPAPPDSFYYPLSYEEAKRQCSRYYSREGWRFSERYWREGQYADCPCIIDARVGRTDPRCVEPFEDDGWNMKSVDALLGYLTLATVFFVLGEAMRNDVIWLLLIQVPGALRLLRTGRAPKGY